MHFARTGGRNKGLQVNRGFVRSGARRIEWTAVVFVGPHDLVGDRTIVLEIHRIGLAILHVGALWSRPSILDLNDDLFSRRSLERETEYDSNRCITNDIA